MKARARPGTHLPRSVRGAGITLLVVALVTSAVLVLATTGMHRLSSRLGNALEMVYAGGQAQRALLVYNRQSELFERTRGSDSQIKPLAPEEDLQEWLTLLDRFSKEWPRRGHLATAAAATVRAYVAAREDWDKESSLSQRASDDLPPAIVSAREEAEASLTSLVTENYELSRALQQDIASEGRRANIVGWTVAVIVALIATPFGYRLTRALREIDDGKEIRDHEGYTIVRVSKP